MSVAESVRKELGEDTSWRAQTAVALAAQVDEGSASAAAQLRALMREIEAEGSAKAGDELDEFRSRRAARGAR